MNNSIRHSPAQQILRSNPADIDNQLIHQLLPLFLPILQRNSHWSVDQQALLPDIIKQCHHLLNSASTAPVEVENIVQQLSWQACQLIPDKQPDSLLICYQSHNPVVLIRALNHAGINTVSVSLNANSQSWQQAITSLSGEHKTVLALFDDHYPAPPSTMATDPLGTRALLHIQQLFGHLVQHPAIKVWLAVRNLHCDCATSITLTSPTALSAAVVWGAAKSLTHEYGQQFAGIIDLNDDGNQQTNDIVKLLSSKSSPSGSGVTGEFRLRQQQIQQRILTPVKTLARAANYQQQRFLITGGLSTLGLLLAEHLAQNGADAIILCHNSAANLGQLQRLTALEQLGCQVQIRQLDVCNEQQVKTLFNDTTVRLDGIFHLAGTSATTCADECKLADLQAEKVQSILSPKTTGSWLLHHCSRSQPLRYFVCFSCVSAVFGCAGQSINSAANYAQSWLASHRHAKGLPALTISWSGQSQSAAQTLETMQQMLLLPNANLLVSSTNFQAKCSYLD